MSLFSIAFAQEMPGMKMPVKKQAAPKIIYTCPMHPEVQKDKPGNCPKCGMRLVKEKPKAAPVNHEGMHKPMKDSSKKMDNMDNMNHNMGYMDMPKADVGTKKFIVNNGNIYWGKNEEVIFPVSAFFKDTVLNAKAPEELLYVI